MVVHNKTMDPTMKLKTAQQICYLLFAICKKKKHLHLYSVVCNCEDKVYSKTQLSDFQAELNKQISISKNKNKNEKEFGYKIIETKMAIIQITENRSVCTWKFLNTSFNLQVSSVCNCPYTFVMSNFHRCCICSVNTKSAHTLL